MRTRRTLLAAGISALGGCVGGIGSTPTATPTPEPTTKAEMREALDFRLRVSNSVVTGEDINVEMGFTAPPKRMLADYSDSMFGTVSFYFEDEYRGNDTFDVSPGSSKTKRTSFVANVPEPGEYEMAVEFNAVFDGFQIVESLSETVEINTP